MYREKIDQMIMEQRKAGNSDVVLVYQALKNEFLKQKTAKNAKELDDAGEISIIKKMVKERTESAELYENGNRKDLADKEKAESAVLEKLLPAGPSEADVKAAIEEFIKTVEVFDRKQMGNCIKFVKAKIPTVDGKQLSQLVQTYF